MDNLQTLQRTLELLLLLNNAQYGYSIENLCERFDITERTCFRYIKTIRNAGFVVDLNDCKYKINKQESEYDISQLLHFSKEESVVLSRAIHSIDNVNTMKSSLIEKLYSLYDSERVVQTILRKEQSENIEELSKAINNKQRILLKNYRSSNSDQVSDRLVEPVGFTPNYVSVWAFEVASKINKQFKTARIETAQMSSEKMQFQELHEAGFTDVFRMSGKERVPVKFRCSLRAYNLMIEEYPLSEKVLSKQGNLYCFDSWVCDFKGVGRFVLGLHEDIKQIENDDFIAYLHSRNPLFEKK